MTSTLNPHFLSQMEATPTLNLQDGTDYPHSGLFDMLHKGLKGSFAYKASATDFDITQADAGSFTSLAIKGGAVFRDGIAATIGSGSGTTTTILLDTSVAEGGYTTNGTSVTANQDVTPVSGGDVYLMIVADASNTIKIRGRNADTNKVPMLLTTDIPIAIVKMTAGSDDDATDRPIQYFTTDKTSNGLQLLYDNSGVAGFAGSISSSSSLTTWTTMQDITINDMGGTTDLILLDNVNDAATGPSISLKNERASNGSNNDVAGTINFGVADDGGSAAAISKIVSKALSVAAGNEYGDMRFSIANQNGSLVETLSLVGSASSGDVRAGINQASPESTLDIGGSLGVAFVKDTTTSKTLDLANSYVVFENASPITVNLPAVSGATNRIYHIKNDGGGAATLTKNGSDTITVVGGATTNTLGLNQGEFVQIVGGSGTWHVLIKGTVL